MESISLRIRFRRGMSLMYGMFAVIALTGFTSLAVDYGRIQLARTQLEQAVDAAARYGAGGLPSGIATVKARVAASAASNKVDGSPLVIDPTNDIQFGIWNANTNTFTVLTGAAQSSATSIRVFGRRLASRNTALPTPFAGVLGKKSMDMSVSAIAGKGQGADVFLIQDITTSFTAQLPDAKIGDQAMLNTLYAGGAGRCRLGIAVHTGWGTTLAPLTQVNGNYTWLTSIISSIKVAGSSGMPVASGTDIASGFDEAITAYTAAGYVAPAAGKTVVLVSDGQPTSNSNGKHPTLNDSQLLTLAQTRANTLWAQNVHIYVVFMDASNDSIAANNLKTLIRGNGDFNRVTDPSQLPVLLAEITNKSVIKLYQ